ncbi:hypothetical protein LWF15_03595 [Kineosporia rhizophila]|uniref:hypothetical protein n=1 Tax=Kineosporia rhizophila TaxID=84633 RepID=UPI001E647770|nr:hypothetical protein [Kineosporia rhizophila]MCE0534582.1 hypothetical protein [Kineosporia rhizophila]
MSAQIFPPPAAAPGRSRMDVAAQWVRWGVLGAFLAAFVLLPTLGERQGRLSNLERDIASGRVSEVAVSGEWMEGGTFTQGIHWRDGLIRRYVEVVSGDDRSVNRGAPRIDAEGAEPYLRQQNPDLSITTAPDLNSYGSIYGWDHLPEWLSAAYVLLSVGVLARLIGGPQPLRATRWAWFWLWTTPLGAPLFLLLARPAPFLPTPRPGARRLTGGYAFLLFLVLTWIF